jgi:predicted ATP-grasp superfamily ATP-dependent carboligase
MKNKMIIIGSANNYNELGLVRSFGVNGIKPYGIIICKAKNWKKDWVHRSKYWKKCYQVETAEDAFALMIEKFGNEELKPVVTTPVDYVMQKIDALYDELSQKFILQSMKSEQNGINKLANKLEQANLTTALGFNTLPTKVLYIESFEDGQVAEDEFPILLKPVQGGEGSKDDITICRDRDALTACIEMLKKKNYQRILCQKYLENREEIVVYGAMSSINELYSYTILKNIRQWPLSYGVGCFAKLITDQNWLSFVKKLFKSLVDYGYDGPIDVELFLDRDTQEVYICEYNWRPGGRNFTSLGTNVYSIVLWYLVQTGKSIDGMLVVNHMDGYSMNEEADYHHVLHNHITRKEWKEDFKLSCAYALYNKKDWKPSIIPWLHKVKSKLLRRNNY